MKKITKLIIKRPLTILLITILVMAVFAIGVKEITLKTGNDTLISDKSDIYQDNEEYEKNFGKDPIILIFDSDQVLDPNSLKLMNKLQQDIKDLDGIFAINSPVTVINQMALKMTEVKDNFNEVSISLSLMASNIKDLSNQVENSGGSVTPNVEQLKQMITNLSTLNNGLQNNISNLDMPDQMKQVPQQTIIEINGVILKYNNLIEGIEQSSETYQTIVLKLNGISTQLDSITNNLTPFLQQLDIFKLGFPQSNQALEMLTYENDEIKDNFKSFVVGNENEHARMVIILEGNITDSQIDIISETLFDRLDKEDANNNVLVSGKPILDRSIKSSMMDSMKYMMISAIVIMIIILLVIYNVRMRLLPMFMILIAVVVTIGIMGWLNMGLTMVSMAVFPILIGLGIDYFIQFQTRYEEEQGKL